MVAESRRCRHVRTQLSVYRRKGRPAEYVDRKRSLWLLSVVYPLFPVAAVWLHHVTGSEWLLIAPIIFSYGLGPLLDWAFGEDQSNPPEQTVPALENDYYYRVLTWLTVPLHVISLVVAVWWAATAGLSLPGWLALAVVAGLASGLAVNTAHEMGHKRSAIEQLLTRIALAVPAYGHFTVEHNFGHHKHVATPDDCASARMGESIYRFALREIPGGLRRAWRIESWRLRRRGHRPWGLRNSIIQSWLLSVLLQGSLIAVFGGTTLLFLLIHNLVAWFQLTSANYVEHYGLLRQRRPDGSYERCQPHHSWNSNHIFRICCCFISSVTPIITPILFGATSRCVTSMTCRACRPAISGCSCWPTCRRFGFGS